MNLWAFQRCLGNSEKPTEEMALQKKKERKEKTT